MSAIAAAQAVPTIPPDVLEFAEQQGVSAYLPAVFALARRVFPHESMIVLLGEDPEIAGYRHIVVEVDVAGWEVSDLVAAQERWSKEIFHICPATHVLAFLLRMV